MSLYRKNPLSDSDIPYHPTTTKIPAIQQRTIRVHWNCIQRVLMPSLKTNTLLSIEIPDPPGPIMWRGENMIAKRMETYPVHSGLMKLEDGWSVILIWSKADCVVRWRRGKKNFVGCLCWIESNTSDFVNVALEGFVLLTAGHSSDFYIPWPTRCGIQLSWFREATSSNTWKVRFLYLCAFKIFEFFHWLFH